MTPWNKLEQLAQDAGAIRQLLAQRFNRPHKPPPAPTVHVETLPGVQVTPGELLYVQLRNSVSSVVVQVRWRILDPDLGLREGAELISPAADRSLVTTTTPVGKGQLLSVAVTVQSGTVLRGQLLAAAFLQGGPGSTFQPRRILGQRYLSSMGGLMWPGGIQEAGRSGLGYANAVGIPQPAAGHDFSLTVPAGVLWRVISLSGTFATAADVQNRGVVLKLLPNGGGAVQVLTAQTQAQNLTWTWSWLTGQPATVQQGALVAVPLPSGVLLTGGSVITSNIITMAPTDQWSGVFVNVEELIEE